jgi:hypothetical protein
MIFRTQRNSKILIVIGLLLACLGAPIWTLTRSGHLSNFSDFTLGLTFGVGVGLTVLGLWRGSRGGGHPTDARSC